MSRHSSPSLKRWAGASPYFSTASGSRSAIVFEPVPASRASALAVTASIASSPSEGSANYLAAEPGRGRAESKGKPAARPLLGARRLFLLRRVLQRAHEEGLVDPSLKDRHPELHALLDDVATVHSRLSSELGGRQVDRHI